MTKKLTIIYNPFVSVIKQKEQVQLFKKAQAQLKIKLDFVRSDEVNSLINQNKHSFSHKILFLDKNIPLAQLLENKGYKLYNSAKSIAICDNKALTHVTLAKTKIRQPKTLIGPLTFNLKKIEISDPFIKQINKTFKYPVVLKEVYGSFGHQVYLINNQNELVNKINTLAGKEFIVQEYLSQKSGHGIRILVINKKIYGAIKQINKNDFRSNLTLGSSGKIVKLPQYAQTMAQKIIKQLNLFYGGIDLIYDNNNRLIFCEANSNAQLTNISKIFNTNFAQLLVTQINEDKNGK